MSLFFLLKLDGEMLIIGCSTEFFYGNSVMNATLGLQINLD